MRSIKTVIRENGLVVDDNINEWSCLPWRCDGRILERSDFPWRCAGRIRGRIYVFGGKSQRDAVNNWLEIRNLFDPTGLFLRSASITSQE